MSELLCRVYASHKNHFQNSHRNIPLGTNARTADTRRIDFILYKPHNGSITLVKISVPDGRAQSSGVSEWRSV